MILYIIRFEFGLGLTLVQSKSDPFDKSIQHQKVHKGKKKKDLKCFVQVLAQNTKTKRALNVYFYPSQVTNVRFSFRKEYKKGTLRDQ